MSVIACNPNPSSSRFRTVAEPFLQQEGLPFADVLSAEEIAVHQVANRPAHIGPRVLRHPPGLTACRLAGYNPTLCCHAGSGAGRSLATAFRASAA